MNCGGTADGLAPRELIVVCPEATPLGWYIYSPVRPRSAIETCLIDCGLEDFALPENRAFHLAAMKEAASVAAAGRRPRATTPIRRF